MSQIEQHHELIAETEERLSSAPTTHIRKEPAMTPRTYRQGDVLIVAINPDQVPTNTRPIRREHGAAVLAHGEATGHAHAIHSRRAQLVTPGTEPELVTAEQARELYLLVNGTQPVALVHQEHATIPIEPGAYRVVRQREYTPEAPVWVAD